MKEAGAGDLMKRYIEEMIKEYTSRPLSPWHMPGHKRKALFGGFWDDAFSRDLTEVPGTDDYHHPEGAIRRSQAAAAKVYGTAYSHYLVGGTTAGILAGILALTVIFREKRGEDSAGKDDEHPVFLVAGNVHRSVHHALRLASADAACLEPEGDPYYGPVLTGEVERVLERLKRSGDQSRVAGCVITSPTYGGAISPLKEIHRILEREGIPLFVDEAHGAHLPFIPELSEYSGIAAGAELVVQSLHKTLPALTQTGIIHVGHAVRSEREKETPEQEASDKKALEEEASEKKVPDLETLETELTRQLAVVQSSSPSYLLLASAEQAVAWADDAGEDFSEYYRRVQRFRKELRDDLSSASAGIILEEFPRIQDPTRIFLRFISSKEGGPGQAVSVARIADHLENDDGIVVELAGAGELILISTALDREEDFDRLREALKRVAERLNAGEFEDGTFGENAGTQKWDNRKATAPKPGDTVKRDIYVYPPGILILGEGDTVTEESASRISRELAAGRIVRGL